MLTDIPEPVISHLISSNIRRVVLVARRGPLQAAFTLKELRELSRLDIGEESSTPHYLPINFLPPGIINDCFPGSEFDENLLQGLPRSRRRLMKFLSELSSKQNYRCSSKRCDIQFLRSPVRIIPTDETRTSPLKSSVRAVELAVNQLVGAASENQDICTNPDAPTEVLECGLVIRSIGYRSVPIDPDLPFDTSRGVIKSKDHRGRVADPEGGGSLNPTLCPLYCSGWVKRGAVGVIAETSVDARITAQTVLVDLATAESQSDPRVTDRHGSAAIEQLLRARG